MKKMIVTLPVLGALMLTGCADSGSTPETSRSASSKSEESVTTSDDVALEELREKFVDAGFECANWRITEKVFSNSSASGACGSSTHLGSFDSSDDVASEVEAKSKLAEKNDLGKLTWVVGETWIVSTKDAKKVQGKLGGEIVKF